MTMEVKTNMPALEAVNRLNKNDKSRSKSLQRVSSGVRITGASDDASGYAISERMRIMIRGLEQDERNIQNGQSLLRVAAGAIDNIIGELRTMKELALNAANDTNTDLDRATIQKELDARRVGINEIAVETTFNGKKLLDGSSMIATGEAVNLSPEEPTGTHTLTASDITSDTITIDSDGVYELDSSVVNAYGGRKLTVIINAANVELKGRWFHSNYSYTNPATFVDQGLSVICQKDDTNLWLNQFWADTLSDSSIITFGKGSNNTLNIKDYAFLGRSFDSRAVANDATTASINIGGGLTILSAEGIGTSGLSTSSGLTLTNSDYYDRHYMGGGIIQHAPLIGLNKGQSDPSANINIVTGTVTLSDQVGTLATSMIGAGDGGSIGDIGIYDNGTVYAKVDELNSIDPDYVLGSGYSGSSGSITYSNVTIIDSNQANFKGVPSLPDGGEIYQNDFRIQHGTKANQNMLISLKSMKTDKLGIDETSVVTRDKATSAISDIDAAIDYALDQATRVGAYISRLEFTLSNVVTSAENVQASESTLRDADIAKEMVEYTKNNVLLQASQSMLAQANQNSSAVISLLQ